MLLVMVLHSSFESTTYKWRAHTYALLSNVFVIYITQHRRILAVYTADVLNGIAQLYSTAQRTMHIINVHITIWGNNKMIKCEEGKNCSERKKIIMRDTDVDSIMMEYTMCVSQLGVCETPLSITIVCVCVCAICLLCTQTLSHTLFVLLSLAHTPSFLCVLGSILLRAC